MKEAISLAADKLYSGLVKPPPVDKETFIILTTLSCTNVVMSTHSGTYRQIDGLAMGSPPAPPLSNIWLSQFEPQIRDDAKLFDRYMDDIVRTIHRRLIIKKLNRINKLHPKLKFTLETEQDGHLPFLDMYIERKESKLSSTWYCKPTDTGLVLNFHAMTPRRYKRAVIQGFVHRIYRACSSWKNFHESLKTAKLILEKNQYPPTFYDPVIKETLESIIIPKKGTAEIESNNNHQTNVKLVMQYRGTPTEKFISQLKRAKVPIQVVLTLRKQKTFLPSLKPSIRTELRSNVVYHIVCSGCNACYVGQTGRHLITRFKEQSNPSKPVGKHIVECTGSRPRFDDVSILDSSNRGEYHLMTLEALYIREIKPTLNTKDEYRSRQLTLKI